MIAEYRGPIFQYKPALEEPRITMAESNTREHKNPEVPGAPVVSPPPPLENPGSAPA